MVEVMIDLLSMLLLVTGGLFGLIGGLGLVRFPDFYTRLHAAGITDTLCALLIVAGLALQSGLSLLTLKLALILLFLIFTAPTASHALARAAMVDGVDPQVDDDKRDSNPGEPPSNT